MTRGAVAGLVIAGSIAATLTSAAIAATVWKSDDPPGQQVFIDETHLNALPFRWGDPARGLVLGLAFSDPSFRQHTPIQVWFAVKNLSQTTQSFFRLGDLSDYDVVLADSTGLVLEPIPGSAGAEFDGSLRPSISVEPNKAFLYKVLDLNDFFTLTPGKYTLSASTTIFQDYADEQKGIVFTELSVGSVDFTITKT